MRTMIAFIFALFSVTSFANKNEYHQPITHVIYITLDGVRRQEIFKHKELMPIFWRDYAKNAVIYGAPGSMLTIKTGAKIPYSLPSYESQMAGVATDCLENNCRQIEVETFPEALIKKAGLKHAEVAAIASWNAIDNAFQTKQNLAFSNGGASAMHDPDTYKIDPTMKLINAEQVRDYKDDETRWDKYTIAQALHYYKKYKPQFLWVSLNDADDYAHAGNVKKYHQSLRSYDRALDKLFKTIKAQHLQQETMVIITTDHGRGLGKLWTEHESNIKGSWDTWAFVMNGQLANGIKEGKYIRYSTLSIRPTVEKVFGIVS